MIQAGDLVTWNPEDLYKIFGRKKNIQNFPYKPPITGFLKDIHGETGILSFMTQDNRHDWIFVRLDELKAAGGPHAE
jgi:hypothetical protein